MSGTTTSGPITATTGMFQGNSVSQGTAFDVQGLLTATEAALVAIGQLPALPRPATVLTAGLVKPGQGHTIGADGTLGATVYDVRAFGVVGDGAADDTAALQAALNAAAGKARLIIPNGLTCLTGYLRVPSNTVLHIDGTLKLKAGANGCVLYNLDGASNVLIEGIGVIDGNYTQQTPGAFSQGIYLVHANKCTIRGITIQNTLNGGWSMTYGQSCLVEGVTCIMQHNTSGFAVQSVDCWAIGCTVLSTPSDYGIGLYGNVHRCGVVNCSISNSGIGGIVVLSDSGQGGPCSDITIANNIIHDNMGGAICIDYNPTPPAVTVPVGTQHTGIVITGNRGFNNLQDAGQLPAAGIYLRNGKNVLIANNHFGPDGTGAKVLGIHVAGSGNATNVVIRGNVIVDQGTLAGAGSCGIDAPDGLDSSITIAHNVVADTRATPKMDTGIYTATPAPAGTVIDGNVVRGIAAPFAVDPNLAQIRQSGARYAFDSPVSAQSVTVAGTDDLATAWTQSAPTPTPTSGSFTSASATVRSKKVGRTVSFSATVNITTNGTAAGTIQVPMPYPAAADEAFGGRSYTGGKAISGVLPQSLLVLYVTLYDGGYAGGDGTKLVLTGCYEAAA